MVISVGYRVSSAQATLFRRWATSVLVRFATKGFVVDAERLKEPGQHDRVAELRDIIRDIRSSEANIYAEHVGPISRADAEARATREYQRFDDKRKGDRREAAARELEALKRTDRSLPKTPRRPVKPS